jgi:cholesterol oxidase
LTDKYSKIVNGKATSFVLEAVCIPSTAQVVGQLWERPFKGVIDKKTTKFGMKICLSLTAL